MKYVEEKEPIILSGSWIDSSLPDKMIKIYQFTCFIIFQMNDDTIGSAKIKGTVKSGDILEATWPRVISHKGRTSGVVHRTVIRVVNENHLELVDDTAHEAGNHVGHIRGLVKWTRIA